MLVLPIVNKKRILNVEIKLNNATKVRSSIRFSDSEASEVVVNGKKLSESIYHNSKEPNAILDFVRNNSLTSRRNFLITTKEEVESSLYDVYEVGQPPKKVNASLDNLYSMALIDMQKETPNVKKGKYVSFEKLGFNRYLTDEKLSALKDIVNHNGEIKEQSRLLEKAGVIDLYETLGFLNNFECIVINGSSIPEEELQNMLNSLENIHTRDAKNLRSYYNMAVSNKEIYDKLSYINKIVYGEPLSLIQSKTQKQKQLVKVNNGPKPSLESEYRKVA